jgi:hypothetical protein
VDHNVCGGATRWEAKSNAPLGAWQSASGFDKASQAVDPRFANAPADLTPAAGSPLLGAADPARTPANDAKGKTRRTTSPSDVAAIER